MRIRSVFTSDVLKNSKLFAEIAKREINSAVLVNIAHLQAHPETPSLYESGVRYRMEPPGVEDVCDIEEVLRRGWADCAMLVAYRVAELRVRHNEKASVRVKWKRHGRKRYFHVVVRRANGRIEDPSIRLGMNSGHGVTVDEAPLDYRRKRRAI